MSSDLAQTHYFFHAKTIANELSSKLHCDLQLFSAEPVDFNVCVWVLGWSFIVLNFNGLILDRDLHVRLPPTFSAASTYVRTHVKVFSSFSGGWSLSCMMMDLFSEARKALSRL